MSKPITGGKDAGRREKRILHISKCRYIDTGGVKLEERKERAVFEVLRAQTAPRESSR